MNAYGFISEKIKLILSIHFIEPIGPTLSYKNIKKLYEPEYK